jgi:hypothetical protein
MIIDIIVNRNKKSFFIIQTILSLRSFGVYFHNKLSRNYCKQAYAEKWVDKKKEG